MATIYHTHHDYAWPEDIYQALLQTMPLHERTKNVKFLRWQDRQAHLLGKLLLKYALTNMGSSQQLENVRYHKNQKPYFEEGPHFNISHSGKYVCCAVSEKAPLGIDIEEIKKISVGDFEKVFTKLEWQSIQCHENSTSRFYELWTRKEAIIKADGRGLEIPLTEINVLNKEVSFEGMCWQMHTLDIDIKYQCHVAVAPEVNRLEMEYVDFETISNLITL